MTIALIDNPARTTIGQKSDTLELKNDGASSSQGSEFGQVMSGVMSPEGTPTTVGMADGAKIPNEDQALNGQALAEVKLDIAGLYGSLGGDVLKAVHLGPRLSVITSETAAPDEQSLEAFARSQGLDETAVQWLMGTAPGLTTAPRALQADEGSILTTTSALNTVGLVSSTGSAAAAASVASSLTAPASMTQDPTATAGGAPAAATQGTGQNAAQSTKPDTPIGQIALSAAALWAMTQQTEKARTTATSQSTLTETTPPPINMVPPPAPAAIWMQRNALGVSPSKEPVTNKNSISLSELDLTGAASLELLESLSQGAPEGGAEGGADTASGAHATPLSGHAGHRLDMSAAARQAAQNSGADPTAQEMGNAQRSENIQNLAEKMGQAVGQRILSEIEKGQWHLKLMLRPATLGHIEVEIRMRSGEMDAVFTAPQAVTRELLQDGMSKLKDTLNQMGMDVASMQVGDGQTQKRGGESTPGQTGKITTTDVDESISTASQSANLTRMKMGLDGWDVLV